ncbi:C1 family peptidase [Legionella micdadei]|nr:C1 family peptidase [Legionella micdadei]ARG97465.1 peptidase C1 [Legionella micdadei]ARH01594.1 peptidase C1 [Legionella micdadei]NSL16986.1 C1 family peptidase [Legionella micdadei]
MELKLITIRALIITLLAISNGYSEEVTITGSIKHIIKLSTNKAVQSKENEKEIQLLRIELSDEEKALLEMRAREASLHRNQFSLDSSSQESTLPNAIQLGMNKVPVLDQGRHGTCVTFAVTGALDALIGKGDYVSQLCHLQLGNYLENHGYSSSGWDGSNASSVISQISQYGIINKEKQRKFGCGVLKEYPLNGKTPKSYIEPDKFASMSELIFGHLANWSNSYYRLDSSKTLNEVKQALNSGDRLVFAVRLPRTDLGTVGAVGKYKTWIDKDTWVLTQEIIDGIKNVKSAHEMIITGYDDNAVAFDNKGKKHKGLLILRNSWGAWAGNYGEFYMSYDYFKLLTFEVKRFSPNSI